MVLMHVPFPLTVQHLFNYPQVLNYVNDQNVVSVTITAGAAGQTDIVAQVAPTLLTTESRRFTTDRG